VSAAKGPLAHDESLVELRCSVAVTRHDAFLLVHRVNGTRDDWVLPGGRPRDGESMAACARREAREETGLEIDPLRCAFVLEVIDPHDQHRMVELVFLAEVHDEDMAIAGEGGSTPEWVPRQRLAQLNLRPPIGGYLAGLATSYNATSNTAPYLGNLWRPGDAAERPRES